MRRYILIILLIVICSLPSAAAVEYRPLNGHKTSMYDVTFNPYPMPIGKDVAIRVYTPYVPRRVTFSFDKNAQWLLNRDGNYWTGTITPPEYLKEGWNQTYIYIRYRREDLDNSAIQKIMAFLQKIFASVKLTEYKEYIIIEGRVWIRAYKAPEITSSLNTIESLSIPQESAPASGEGASLASAEGSSFISAEGTSSGSMESILAPLFNSTMEARVTTEAAPSAEASWIKVKGSKSISFVNRSIEGSKEGFTPGMTREESLRLNITGKAQDGTEVDANFISTSSSGTTSQTQNDEKYSVLVRRASTEAYLGDFIADFNDTEFARLNKSLQGVKISGNYDKWGFKALYSTPRGQPEYFRSYGDGTQGPYNLGMSPVVVDTDKVYLDGIEQKRGDDYTIDYQAGTITFRRSIIITTSIIEVYYDWSENLYQHYTMGLRYTKQVNDDLKIGATYLDDSDSLYKAGEIRDTLSSTIEPQSHIVVGVDGSGKLGNTKIDSEIAYSKMDLDILEPGTSMQTGKAAKINTQTIQGPFTLLTNYKRVGPGFTAIADSSPMQNVWAYGGLLGFKPSDVYYAEANYQYDSYDQLGTAYLTEYSTLKSKFTPTDIPTLNYMYQKNEDLNDPVLANRIDRITTVHDADSSYKYAGFLVSTVGGRLEDRVDSYPTRETTTYKTVNFGTATYGLEKISASGNVEFKETELPDHTSPYTRTYNANLSATPNKDYFGALSLQLVDDSVAGMSNVTDLNYRAAPRNDLSTDGKYTIYYVKEDFNGTPETVSRQSGSFKLDYKPIDTLRCRYYYKPSFTWMTNTDTISYYDYINQVETMYSPLREMSTGIVYGTDDQMNIDRTDPNFKLESNHTHSYDTTLLFKDAPLRFLSIELTYLNSDLSLQQQITPDADANYHTIGNTKKYDLDAKTSLTERFSIDTRYTWQNQIQLTDVASSDIRQLTQTVYGKALWNYDANWIFFINYSYSEMDDAIADQITYTDMPGGGISYIYDDVLRIDAEYDKSMSFSGAETQVDTYSLKIKYDPNQYAHINLRINREISVDPDYKDSEVMGSVEIVL